MISLRKIDTRTRSANAGLRALSITERAPTASAASNAAVAPSAAQLVRSTVLSGVAGYVDAAGFLLLLGVFPAHLTGELVGDAIALSAGQLGARASRSWVFPVFIGAIVLATIVRRMLRQRGRNASAGLLALVSVSLALFSLSDVLARLFHEHHLSPLASGSFAVAAMAIQTVLMRESQPGSCPTTVMTGNLAHVVMELAEQLLDRATKSAARTAVSRSRLPTLATALLAFASCAALGGLLARYCGSLSALLPTVATAALAFGAWRREVPQTAVVEAIADRRPWFTDDELWPESAAPLALSQPYTEPSSTTRIKAGRVVLRDTEPSR